MPYREAAPGFSYPGIDPRVWISYAIVDDSGEGEGEKTVEFDEDDGQVYVNVLLKPMDTPLRCRVGGFLGGPGEASYFPFIGGDEVLVAIPEGHMRAGAVIISRLNNFYDAFPFKSVASADPDKNSFGMIRTRTAFTIEAGASIMLRSAAAGAFLQLSAVGNVMLRDSAKNVLQMSPQVFGYQSGDSSTILQLDLEAKRFNLVIGNAQLTMCGDAGAPRPESILQVPAALTVAAGGTNIITAVEHVLTTEALFNILASVLPAIFAVAAVPLTFTPPPPDPLSPFYSAIALAIKAASATPQNPAVAAALFTAFAAPTPKPPGALVVGQSLPGIGCPNFLAG